MVQVGDFYYYGAAGLQRDKKEAALFYQARDLLSLRDIVSVCFHESTQPLCFVCGALLLISLSFSILHIHSWPRISGTRMLYSTWDSCTKQV